MEGFSQLLLFPSELLYPLIGRLVLLEVVALLVVVVSLLRGKPFQLSPHGAQLLLLYLKLGLDASLVAAGLGDISFELGYLFLEVFLLLFQPFALAFVLLHQGLLSDALLLIPAQHLRLGINLQEGLLVLLLSVFELADGRFVLFDDAFLPVDAVEVLLYLPLVKGQLQRNGGLAFGDFLGPLDHVSFLGSQALDLLPQGKDLFAFLALPCQFQLVLLELGLEGFDRMLLFL